MVYVLYMVYVFYMKSSLYSVLYRDILSRSPLYTLYYNSLLLNKVYVCMLLLTLSFHYRH